jgi:type IV secretory pathway TraG/TraD family ATPase VirD4
MFLYAIERFLSYLIERKNNPIQGTYNENIPLREQPLQWGKIEVPEEDAQTHFMAVGTTGSGKTTFLRLLMQSALPKVGTGDYRAIVYDAKQDALPILSSIVPDADVITLNPFDQRGVAWDMAADVNEPRLIFQVASILFPKQQDTTQFFRNATVHVAYGVMLSFVLSGYPYVLADVFRALRNYPAMLQILRRHKETAYIAKFYFGDKKLRQNILASFAVNALPYEHAASCWEHASEKVSIRDWSQSDQILVLGNSEVSREALDNINRCIFKVATNITLDKPESRSSASWFFLDEVSEAGKLDGLVSLLKKGRSKGARVALAFQSISGLRDQMLYGQHGTDELLGQIGTKFIGRLECVATAEHFSQLVGEQEIVSVSTSYTSGNQSSSSTISYGRQVKKALLASQLMGIRPCSIENGLTGYCMSPHYGIYKTHLDGHELFNYELIPPDPHVPHFIPRPLHHQMLRDWTKSEARQLGLLRKPKRSKGLPVENNPQKRIALPDADPLKGAFE